MSATRMTGEEGYLEDQKRMSFQCLALESCFNVKQNTIEFKKTIPRELLIYKKPNRVNAV
ncbi:hypothetical protein [Wolbachia endosymbiont (group B) of Limnophora tigrina]|uniref:hypothetical protein n=1 Tax=Wolbachia endosymbiont (group B) of Limnophora tigrina TaxID=3139317 RepID=UPI0035B513B1